MAEEKRAGRTKKAGTHKTLTNIAKPFVAFCKKQKTVVRCSPGYIHQDNGIKTTVFKLGRDGARILVEVIGESAAQTISVYCTNEKGSMQKTMEVMARWIRNNDFQLRFKKT